MHHPFVSNIFGRSRRVWAEGEARMGDIPQMKGGIEGMKDVRELGVSSVQVSDVIGMGRRRAWGKRVRDKERETETETETDRQTETETETDRQTERQRQRQTDRQTESQRQRYRETERVSNKNLFYTGGK